MNGFFVIRGIKGSKNDRDMRGGGSTYVGMHVITSNNVAVCQVEDVKSSRSDCREQLRSDETWSWHVPQSSLMAILTKEKKSGGKLFLTIKTSFTGVYRLSSNFSRRKVMRLVGTSAESELTTCVNDPLDRHELLPLRIAIKSWIKFLPSK